MLDYTINLLIEDIDMNCHFIFDLYNINKKEKLIPANGFWKNGEFDLDRVRKVMKWCIRDIIIANGYIQLNGNKIDIDELDLLKPLDTKYFCQFTNRIINGVYDDISWKQMKNKYHHYDIYNRCTHIPIQVLIEV